MVLLCFESWISELPTMSLEDSRNQLSKRIDPAMWNDSNFSLVNFSVYSVIKWEWKQPWLFITTYKGHIGLQLIVRLIIGFVLHIALHKCRLEFDRSGLASIWHFKILVVFKIGVYISLFSFLNEIESWYSGLLLRIILKFYFGKQQDWTWKLIL